MGGLVRVALGDGHAELAYLPVVLPFYENCAHTKTG